MSSYIPASYRLKDVTNVTSIDTCWKKTRDIAEARLQDGCLENAFGFLVN